MKILIIIVICALMLAGMIVLDICIAGGSSDSDHDRQPEEHKEQQVKRDTK